MDDEKVSRRVKWGVIGLLAICAVLALTLLAPNPRGDSALWFVGLLVLMATALTLTAIVFGGLNLNDANEAFGLPSGSVRTLLAVGVMVLFAVFGLKFFSEAQEEARMPRPGDKPFEQIEVPLARLPDEITRYKQVPSLLVVVASPGRAASGTDAGANAKLNLYTLESRPSASAMDAQKQLLTAIITLLTTVVGFYFGSKSAGDGLRARNEGTPADPAAPQRQQAALATERDALEAHIKSDRETLEALRNAPGDVDAARRQKLDEAQGLSSRLDALRDQLARALTEAQTRLGAIAAAPAGGEAAARDAAQKALARASTELDALKQAAQQFEAAVAQLRTPAAKTP
ncbi:hypothetical protein [Roseateles sp. P5_E1]